MQHVNLLAPELQERRDRLRARNLALALVALTAALAGGGYWMHERIAPLEREVAALERERDAVQRSLDALREELAATREDGETDERIAALRQKLSAGKEALALLDSQRGERRGGFSPYLQGLAESVVEGLWLSTIRIEHGGDRLRLAGHALQPGQVPQLVRALARSQAYRGHVFRTVRLARSEEAEQRLDFVLASGAPEEGEP